MTQRGESDAFSASEHITALQANVDRRIFDYVIVNTDMATAFGEVQAVLRAERLKRKRQTGLTKFVRELTANL